MKTYVDNDLRLLGLTAQPLTISRLLRVLSTANGKMFSYNDIANVMDLALPTIKNYKELRGKITSLSRLQVSCMKVPFRISAERSTGQNWIW